MKRIEKISLGSTLFFLFYFLFFLTITHAQIRIGVNEIAMEGDNCAQITKKMKLPLKKVMMIHKGMQNILKSDEPVDKYNRHVNILLGNLELEAGKMGKLMVTAEQRGCSKLINLMRDQINNTKNIFQNMMATIQLAAPKKPLTKQNEELKSELDNLMEVHRKLSSIQKSKI